MAGKTTGIGTEERTVKRIFSSWFTVVLSSVLGIALAYHFHYQVPLPANHLGYNEQGLSDFSERNAVNIISHLSDTIGYRKSILVLFFLFNLFDIFFFFI